MCGIVGFNWQNKKLLQYMCERIKHRGPDEQVLWTDENVSLGMQRLAIIDLNENLYPVHSYARDVQVIFNGEIYNYNSLKDKLKKIYHFITDTDAEVIPHLYKYYYKDFTNVLKHLEGQFAICLYDSKLKKIYLARDRLGVCPLYYSYFNGKFIFASEIKSLLVHISPILNRDVLDEYFGYGCVIAPNTLFKGIYKLRPGHMLELDLHTNQVLVSKYFEFNLSKQYNPLDVSRKVYSSIKKRLNSDVPLGVYLSGGLDSSTIVVVMSEYTDEINTFSMAFDSDTVPNELNKANLVADMYKTNHHKIKLNIDAVKYFEDIIYYLDEPIPNFTNIAAYVLAKETSQYVKVVLSGDGGDECFQGSYRQQSWVYQLSKLPSIRLFSWFPGLLGLFFKNRYLKYGSKFIKYANNPAKAYHELRFQGKGPFEPIKRIFELDTDVLNKCVLADIKLTLSNNYLHNSDRMNMAHSLEARPPFTDYKLIEFFMNIPIEYKLRWFQSRILVKLLMKTKLPEKILTQKKFGFNAPLKDWYLSYLKKKYIKYIPEKHLTDTNENINEAFKHITFNVWRKIYGVQG